MNSSPTAEEQIFAELQAAEALYQERSRELVTARREALKERRAAFVRAREWGVSYRNIGERLGLNKSRVIQIVKGRNK